jgi:hypothetical protein
MSGWIKIHRSITNHWLYSEKRVYSKLEAWYDMLIAVNYSDSKTLIKGKLYEVKRGQSIMSLDSWAKRWSWDKSKVRRFLNTLQNDNMIELKSDTITTQLTICNYESYQGERNADETPVKRKRNADETQTTPIEERKENKEENIYRKFKHLSISFDEFNKLCIDYTKQQVDDILDQIENYSQNKKFSSLYLTAKNWLKRNEKQNEITIVDPLVEYVNKQLGL